jgi:hypothetical protein
MSKRKASKELITKHVAILKKLAAKGKGKLPSYTWINAHGFFHSYDVVREHRPSVLKSFRRVFLKKGRKHRAA